VGAGSSSSNDVSLTQDAVASASAPVGSPPQSQGNGAHSTNGKNGHNGNGNGHLLVKPHPNSAAARNLKRGWRKRFFLALEKTGNISLSAKRAGVNRWTVCDWKKRSPEFASAVEDAVDIATAALEEEVRRRAHQGTLKPVFYKGSKCGAVREYSDTLAMFILKARKPEVYRDNAPAVTVNTSVSQHTDVTKAFEQIAADNSRVAQVFENRLTGRN
jgi:hypothetical protein